MDFVLQPGPTLDRDLFEQMCRNDEAVRGRVYDDATGQTIGPGTLVKGNPTIGVGRNVGPTGPGLRDSEIQFLLDQDTAYYDTQAATFPWYTKLDPVRATVVATLIFEMGLRKFTGFIQTIAALEAGDYVAAAADMLQSEWATEVGDRAKRLALIMKTGVPISR